MKGKTFSVVAILVVLALLLGSSWVGADGDRIRAKWIITDKFTVLEGTAAFNSDVTLAEDLSIVGDISVDDVDVAGSGTGLRVGGGYGSTGCTLSAAGALSCDGAATLAGGADLNGTQLTLGADAGIYMDESGDGDYRFVMGGATDVISFTVGSIAVGNGVPTNALNAEDAYIEGTLEVDGANYFASGSIDATEIANVSRAVNLPLMSWFECSTDAGTTIGWGEGADALPDFINSSTDGLGAVLRFDDAGGQIDNAYICATAVVPPDYASGGALVLEIAKDAETGANTEYINCAGSINGAALGAYDATLITGAAAQSLTCTPTLAGLAAGNALNWTVYVTGTASVDDVVDLLGVEFTYTATQ